MTLASAKLHLIVAAPYLALCALVLAVIAFLYMLVLRQRLSRLLLGRNGSLEETITVLAREMQEMKVFRSEVEKYLKLVETRLRGSVSGLGVVRFNPFEGTGQGGNQSFAAALLDEEGQGVVLSTLYARDRVGVYAKPLEGGSSNFELTGEEKRAIEKAQSAIAARKPKNNYVMNAKELPSGSRPPIVAIVGHIDHGKSTLLDYIRRANVAAGEAGGITQHLSAYEAAHENASGKHTITFLDTPGHEAFAAMRSRGLEVADVAILVISAEEGVKPQTMEAVKLIKEVDIPFIVALTKVDKPSANVERAKMSLLENGIYLEGMGGEVPFVAVSGKTGEGVPELLDLILLAGELEGLSADAELPGEGLVIEAHVDPKRGNTATLIVKNGAIESGEFVVSGESFAPVRIMENFLGKPIKEALPGSPVVIVGFSTLPQGGAAWRVVESKKEAEADVAEYRQSRNSSNVSRSVVTSTKSDGDIDDASALEEQKMILPLVIKTDVAGTGDAVLHEFEKLPKDERLEVRIVSRGVGSVSESDVKLVSGSKVPGIIVGFNVKVEGPAKDLAERHGVAVAVFDIIYKLTEWLGAELEKRRPRQRVEEVSSTAKIIKVFSSAKNRVVLGGRVESGTLKRGAEIKILRRDAEIGRGSVVSLQAQKRDVEEVEAGSEFGAMLKTSAEPAAGDHLEAFIVEMK